MFNVGDRLKQLRKLNNISANKLAEAININPSTLTKIETGNSLPSLQLLDGICSHFNISLSDFFKLDECLLPGLVELNSITKDLSQSQIQSLISVAKTFKEDNEKA